MRDRGAAPKVGEGGGQKVRARQGRGETKRRGETSKDAAEGPGVDGRRVVGRPENELLHGDARHGSSMRQTPRP